MKRRHKSKVRHICLLLSMMAAAVNVLPAHAVGEAVEEAEERVQEAEAKAENLEEAGARLEDYLEELNAELDQLSADIETLAVQRTQLNGQLEETKAELETAKEKEADQYDDMKLRIQYMYENRDAGFMGLIFSEDSLSAILNKAEYAMEMASYDRRMLQEYKETKELVAQKESDLLTEQEALTQVVLETETKKDEVLAAIGETAIKMEECAGDLEDAQGQLARYRSELQQRELEAEEQLAELEENETQIADGNGSSGEGTQAADPDQPSGEAPTEAPTGPGESTQPEGPAPTQPQPPTEAPTQPPTEAPTQPPTEAPTQPPAEEEIDYSAYSDLELMAAMIYREANMEPWEGKVAVGNVIMNRIRSSRYPNTMLGVLSQPYQFSPWGKPKYINALKNGVNSECVRAAEVAMSGSENYIGDLLHFRMVAPGYEGIIIGGHVFY